MISYLHRHFSCVRNDNFNQITTGIIGHTDRSVVMKTGYIDVR